MNDSYEDDRPSTSDRVMLARLDERMRGIQSQVMLYQQTIVAELSGLRADINAQGQNFDRKMTELSTDVDKRMSVQHTHLREKIDLANKRIDTVENEYVTKASFDPILRLVFGAVGLILTGFLGAVVTFFLQRG